MIAIFSIFKYFSRHPNVQSSCDEGMSPMCIKEHKTRYEKMDEDLSLLYGKGIACALGKKVLLKLS